MEELLIETRKVRKLLEVLVSQTHAEPANPGIIDETADNARRWGLAESNDMMPAHAGQAVIPLSESAMRIEPRNAFIQASE